jgi:tetratricopeptide (TPR) repeat protein/predicted Ser/Thr protein kinase
LASHDATDVRHEHPLGEPTEVAGGDARHVDTQPLSRGDLVARYTVLERIGAGGMGVVYAAYDPELDRRVAVKLLKSDRADRAATLMAEGRALARLADPNVVSVFDIGRMGEAVFVAMELVDGETLGEWLRTRRAWQEILRTFIAAGHGLAAAHRSGLVHRDFKPGNVMIDARGRVRVMDFGLAMPTSTPHAGLAGMGTPRYMAPEQILGQPITPATDQFAFCVALFEALAGRHPFGAHDDARGIALAIAEEAPRSLVVPGLPARARRAIERGLARLPSARWPSMDALLVELGFERRRRLPWVLGIAAAGLVTALSLQRSDAERCASVDEKLADLLDPEMRAATAAALAAYARDFDAPEVDVAARVDAWARSWATAHVEACLDTRVRGTEEVRVMEARHACLANRRRSFDAIVRSLVEGSAGARERVVELVDALPDVDACRDPVTVLDGVEPPPPESVADVDAVRSEIDRARRERIAGRYPEGEGIAAAAVERARSTAYAPLVAEALWQHGEALAELQRNDAAEAALEEAAWLALTAGPREVAMAATADLVVLEREVSRIAQTLRWRDRARALMDPIRDAVAAVRVELGVSRALREVGRFDEALVHARNAHERALAELGEDHEVTATSRLALATVHIRLQAYAEGEGLAREAIAMRRRLFGRRHPEVARALLVLASAHAAQGRLSEAIEEDLEALQLLRQGTGARSRMVAAALNNLGNAYGAQGDFDRAAASFAEALEIWEELGHEDSSVYATANLAELALRRGDGVMAVELFRRARAILDRAADGTHLLSPTVDVGLVAALLFVREDAEAEAHIRIALARPSISAEPVWPAMLTVYLAECERRRGGGEITRDRLRAALEVLEAEPRHFEWSDEAVVLARALLAGEASD